MWGQCYFYLCMSYKYLVCPIKVSANMPQSGDLWYDSKKIIRNNGCNVTRSLVHGFS